MHSLCPWIIKTCFPPLNAWFCASRSKWITHVRCDWKAVEYYFFGCCQSEYINTNTHFWTFIRSFSRLLPIIATAHQAHQTEPRANKKDFKLKQCPWIFFLLLCSFLVCCKIRCVVGICDSEWYTHALNSIIKKKHWTGRFLFLRPADRIATKKMRIIWKKRMLQCHRHLVDQFFSILCAWNFVLS